MIQNEKVMYPWYNIAKIPMSKKNNIELNFNL